MHTHRVLFVLTSADHMGDASEPTGSWLEEVAAPYYAFKDARCEVTFASPKGGPAPIDPKSRDAVNATASTRRFDADPKANAMLDNTKRLADLNPDAFDAVFFAGGHGTVADFPTDASVRAIVEKFYADGKPLSAICHAPACFINTKKPNGEPLIAGHRFTCFSNEEEISIGLEHVVPFLVETRLRELGGRPRCEPPFTSNVIIDQHLITGQNPASAIPLAETVITQLRAKTALRDAA